MLDRIGFRSLACQAAAATMLTFGSINANAIVLNFSPTADGDVQVFGGDDVDTTDTGLVATQSGGLARNIILEYDLQAIGDTSTINSLSLNVTLSRRTSQLGSDADVEIYAYAGDGVVNIADFNAAATQVFDGTIPAFPTAGGDTGASHTFNLTNTAFFESLLPSDQLTLRIETNNFVIFGFASTENGQFAAPLLTVDFDGTTNQDPGRVPEPGTLLLGLAGLVGVGAARRAKRA